MDSLQLKDALELFLEPEYKDKSEGFNILKTFKMTLYSQTCPLNNLDEQICK